jgi:hypothetical protein
VARKTKTKKPSKHLRYPEQPERIGSINPVEGVVLEDVVAAGFSLRATDERTLKGAATGLAPIYRDDAHGIWLYQGNCLAILDAIAAKHPDGCFDMIAVERRTASCEFRRP